MRIEINNVNEVTTPVRTASSSSKTTAPSWFVNMVQPPPTELRRWLYNPMIPPTGILVRADPSDEIDETWNEVKSLLILLFVFISLANILVYIVMGRYLAPLQTISSALSDIEKGNYQKELPHFRLPELNQLAMAAQRSASLMQFDVISVWANARKITSPKRPNQVIYKI